MNFEYDVQELRTCFYSLTLWVAELSTTNTNTAATTTTTTQQSVHQQNPPHYVPVSLPSSADKPIHVPVRSYNGLCNAIQDLFTTQYFSLYSVHKIYNDESLNKYWMHGGGDTVYVMGSTECQINIQTLNLPTDSNNPNYRGGNPPSTNPSQPLSTEPSQPPPTKFFYEIVYTCPDSNIAPAEIWEPVMYLEAEAERESLVFICPI
jgi:hypothetical protein